MIRKETVRVPAFVRECGAYVGKLRDLYNYDLNEAQERFKRGGRSEYVNILGVQGELVFMLWLYKNGVDFTAPPLLSNKPITSADVHVGRHGFDVKTIRSDAPDLLVSIDVHHKAKNVQYYVFVRFDSNERATFWMFGYNEVSAWKTKNTTYNDVYYLPLSEIGDGD